jgi:hypothetical protein
VAAVMAVVAGAVAARVEAPVAARVEAPGKFGLGRRHL